MNYEEAVQYIEDIPKFTKKHTAEHTRMLLSKLGNPCSKRKIIHVAGTNGKGSVCAYMQAILFSENKRTGLFTSPHLVELNERIRMDGENISNEEFLAIFQLVKSTVDAMMEEGIAHPSYFEFLYAMGMCAFEKSGVEYVILETGLGGRLDATNSFQTPFLTVITSVGMDHMMYLGDTLAEIAAEKAGIIKEKVPLIFDSGAKESNVVIRQIAAEKGAPCREVTNRALEIKEITDKHIAFSFANEYDKNTIWQVKGVGIYQVHNAALAIEAMCQTFGECHCKKWKKALAEVQWQGRMEEVAPGVIIDGAHNLPAVEQFVKSIKAQQEQDIVILFSAVEDKDYQHMIEVLCKENLAKSYVITGLKDKRGADRQNLKAVFTQYTDKSVLVRDSLEEALSCAMQEKGKAGKLYCLGSLYLVGELKKLLGGRHA